MRSVKKSSKKEQSVVPDELLERLSVITAEKFGLHFPRKRLKDLERGIINASEELGFNDVCTCINQFTTSQFDNNQLEILIGNLTTGETYFFREPKSFEALEKLILPELIRLKNGSGNALRIWSAGCCTGEEAYSIAILLDRILKNPGNWNIDILATDINPMFLKKAREGRYREWSFRGTPDWVRSEYFTKKRGGEFQLSTRIKKMVRFSYLNLVEDSYPSLLNDTNAMDIIFCRNVLIYFTAEHIEKVIRNLYRSLLSGGWMITGMTEWQLSGFPQFTKVKNNSMTLFKRTGNGCVPLIEHQYEIVSKQEAVEPEWLKQANKAKSRKMVRPGKETRRHKVKTKKIESAATSKDKQAKDRAEIDSEEYEKAAALFENGSYSEAIRMVENMTDYRQSARALELLSRSYANTGNLEEAGKWCEEAVAADITNAGCHYLYATIVLEQGNPDEALTLLKRAIYLDPDFVIAHFALGNVARLQGKEANSKRHFRNARELLHRYPEEEVLPESDGINAGRLGEIIDAILIQ